MHICVHTNEHLAGCTYSNIHLACMHATPNANDCCQLCMEPTPSAGLCSRRARPRMRLLAKAVRMRMAVGTCQVATHTDEGVLRPLGVQPAPPAPCGGYPAALRARPGPKRSDAGWTSFVPSLAGTAPAQTPAVAAAAPPWCRLRQLLLEPAADPLSRCVMSVKQERR